MSKNQKILGITGVFILGLLYGSALVSADSNLYDITKVKVNGIEMSGTTMSDIELDDSVEVEVYIDGTGNATTCPGANVDDCAVEVQVKAWIGGYEYDDIEATSDEFDIEPGVSYKETLTLEIPEDLDVEDNEYTLYVEVYDSEDSERESYTVFAERPEHSLNIVDVIYESSVDAGDTTTVEVRIENLGEEKEDDIQVEVELVGSDSAVTYIDELAAFEEDNEDEESSDSAFLTLEVDADLASDYYDLLVTVTYDRDHESIEESYKVWVDGEDSEDEEEEGSSEEGEAQITISLSSTSLKGTEGEATTVTLTFTNSGSATETYTVTVNGEEQWSQSSVTPSSIQVDTDEAQDITITLTPEDDAKGNYDFSLQVLNANGDLVKDIAMTMDVEEDSSGGLFGDTSSMLKVGFIILIVLIIIIGLIVAFRKLKDDDDDDPLEPKEGKTYY